MKNNQIVDPLSQEGVRKAEEKKIASKMLTSRSVWDFFHSIKDAFFKLFDNNETERKVQEKIYVCENTQLADKRAMEKERVAREKDNERFESRREERKRDEARSEVRREENKRCQLKQDLRIFGK
jgi:hypothetical protein